MRNVSESFLSELASSSPTPGGGGASAYCGMLACALGSMVANLTSGKSRYASMQAQIDQTLEELSSISDELFDLIDADARAFDELSKAYSLPKDTTDAACTRNVAIQDALGPACDAPIQIAQRCHDVLEHCLFLAKSASRLAISDAGAAALMAKAALVSATLNVYINASSMDDEDVASRYRHSADSLIESGSAIADEAFSIVAEHLGAPIQKTVWER